MRALLTTAVFLLFATAGQAQISIGGAMPKGARSVAVAGGGQTSLQAEMGSKGLVVAFWSVTCPWAKRYEDRLLALAREYGPAGVGFVALNPNDASARGEGADAMAARVGELSYPFPFAQDAGGAVAAAFGAQRTPHIYFFDASGTLRYEGAIDDSASDPAAVQKAYLREAMDRSIAGLPIEVEKTNAFGCTVKAD